MSEQSFDFYHLFSPSGEHQHPVNDVANILIGLLLAGNVLVLTLTIREMVLLSLG
jgi:hypothetical protein